MKQSGRGFTQDMSLMLKGAAILLMIWHHSFLAGRFEAYDIYAKNAENTRNSFH